jgi:hypothetical protein
MLDEIVTRLSRRISPGTYHGFRKAMLPLDFGLSVLAKRNYQLYRLWHRYADLTNPYFCHADPGAAACPPELLESLQAHGHALQENAYPADAVAEARAWLIDLYERALPRLPAGDAGDALKWEERGVRHEFYPRTGNLRFYVDEAARPDLPRAVTSFMDDGVMHALAQAYFGTTRVLPRLPYFMAEVLLPRPHTETWHLDCLRPTLKTFLFLDDVRPAQGPLRVIAGSHLQSEEQHRIFYRLCRGGPAGAYFEPEEDRKLDPRGVPVTGRAGSVAIFDTRMLHAGSCCTSGMRLILVNGYRPEYALRVGPRHFRDPEPALLPWQRTSGGNG